MLLVIVSSKPSMLSSPETTEGPVEVQSLFEEGNNEETSSPSAPDLHSPTTHRELQAWNPMESDFLSPRNIYKVDDEDASSALQGYSE